MFFLSQKEEGKSKARTHTTHHMRTHVLVDFYTTICFGCWFFKGTGPREKGTRPFLSPRPPLPLLYKPIHPPTHLYSLLPTHPPIHYNSFLVFFARLALPFFSLSAYHASLNFAWRYVLPPTRTAARRWEGVGGVEDWMHWKRAVSAMPAIRENPFLTPVVWRKRWMGGWGGWRVRL